MLLLSKYNNNMASRTNKMWIMKQKKQAEKQKKIIWDSAKSSLEWQKREYTNPKGNSYIWFFRVWKLICDNTTSREDPDGYRAIRKPNSWEVDFSYKWFSSWAYRRYIRKVRKQNRS